MLPSIVCSNFCGERIRDERILISSVVCDALVSITALVIGILGLLALTPHIPPAAYYSLMGLGGAIILADILTAFLRQCLSMHYASRSHDRLQNRNFKSQDVEKGSAPSQSGAVHGTTADPELPDELWLKIFKNLNGDASLTRVPQVCKRFRAISSDSTLIGLRNLAFVYRLLPQKGETHFPRICEALTLFDFDSLAFSIADKLQDPEWAIQAKAHIIIGKIQRDHFDDKANVESTVAEYTQGIEFPVYHECLESIARVLIDKKRTEEAQFILEKVRANGWKIDRWQLPELALAMCQALLSQKYSTEEIQKFLTLLNTFNIDIEHYKNILLLIIKKRLKTAASMKH